jgi:UDP-2-acetamido-3-amino-2,3-dideoxy-glucuronate N-acetyltransferase
VVGKDAMAVFDDTKPWNEKLSLYRHSVKSSEGIQRLEKAEVDYRNVQESEPLKNECLHFIDVVNSKCSPITDGEEGLRVLNVLTKASSQTMPK